MLLLSALLCVSGNVSVCWRWNGNGCRGQAGLTPGKARTPREQRQKRCVVVDEAVEKCQMVQLRGGLVERVDDW